MTARRSWPMKAVCLPVGLKRDFLSAAGRPFGDNLSGRGAFGRGRNCSGQVRLSPRCFPYSVPIMPMHTGRII
jgi:hypothetical protein